MKNKISFFFKPYAAILFLENRVAGGLLMLLTFINPDIGISGVFALLSTILFAEFSQMRQAYLEHGFYLYNSLLVGMGVGYLFAPSFESFILIFLLAVLTFLFSFALSTLFSYYKIPILSLPFSIVTIVAYLASLKYSGLFSTILQSHAIYTLNLPLYINAYFKSLGGIFFLPYTISGIVMAILLLSVSRIMFMMSIIGFYFGVGVHTLLIDSWVGALNDHYAFNYILISLALGGIFLLPTLYNYVIALLGVALGVILVDATQVFFNYYSIPIFTLPFNMVIIPMLFLLGTIQYKGFNKIIKKSPEESLSYYLQTLFRFGPNVANIALPFSGNWNVYQGFNGKWTHKGAWRYAYDFVIEKNGKSYDNEGNFPQDYYCFGQSIISPISGYVVSLRGDLVDNIIGTVDRINNWGNYIVIRSDLGFYVELSHLMQHSILVKEGEYIHLGQIIAKCGNSGYSPQPHLHIQVQYLPTLGSATIPFRFLIYKSSNRLFFHSLPNEEESISSILPNKFLQMQLGFVLDDVMRFEYYKENELIGIQEWKVDMNYLGEFYFTDGKNRLFFYNNDSYFYFYNYEGDTDSILAKLFLLAPRIPLSNLDDISYQDTIPIKLIESKLKRTLLEFFSTFIPNISRRDFDYKITKGTISSSFGTITLDKSSKGFSKITWGENNYLRRIS